MLISIDNSKIGIENRVTQPLWDGIYSTSTVCHKVNLDLASKVTKPADRQVSGYPSQTSLLKVREHTGMGGLSRLVWTRIKNLEPECGRQPACPSSAEIKVIAVVT